jgi:hypothetical protein
MTSEQLQKGYTTIKDKTYSFGSIMKRALPNIFAGITDTALYFSLNFGARKWHNGGLTAEPFKNAPDMPVDFDVTKYVKPFKESLSNN